MDKFSDLRGLLLEPARSAIVGFALTSKNYEAEVELFGKKTAIQKTLVNELLNTRPVFTLHMVFTHTPLVRQLNLTMLALLMERKWLYNK